MKRQTTKTRLDDAIERAEQAINDQWKDVDTLAEAVYKAFGKSSKRIYANRLADAIKYIGINEARLAALKTVRGDQ